MYEEAEGFLGLDTIYSRSLFGGYTICYNE